MLLSIGLESVLGGFLHQFDPCASVSTVSTNSISMSIAVVRGFLAALIQISTKCISARREITFSNAFSIGLGFGLLEDALFSVYTYRAVAFRCLARSALNPRDLFAERIIAASFHVISTLFLISNSKKWGGRYCSISL